MKTYWIMFTVFLSALLVVRAQAASIEVPEYMKDGVITVTLKDGKTYTFSTNDHAVVVRECDCEASPNARVLVSRAYTVRPNSVKVYGGVGPDGLEVTASGSSASVEQDYGFNYGLGYGRQLSNEISLDGLMLLNRHGIQGGLLGVGYNF